MPVGNVNENTGIQINTDGAFNGTGHFSSANPEQTGNSDVKYGAFGRLVPNTQTGQYTYTPDFAKIEPLNSGETGIDQFAITLTSSSGTVSTGTYRVEIVGDGEPTPNREVRNDVLIGNFSRRGGSKPDAITNLNPETDKLVLDYEYYGLTDGIRFRSTTHRPDLKRFAQRDLDLIALEQADKFELWWNQNGVGDGRGDGEMVAVLAGNSTGYKKVSDSSLSDIIGLTVFDSYELRSLHN